MSDTPETDAEVMSLEYYGESFEGCCASLARKLERERDEARRDGFELSTQIPRWIPVGEKLPENDAGVLVYCDDGIHPFIECAWYDDGWHGSEPYELDDVTHWQPMPKGPVE